MLHCLLIDTLILRKKCSGPHILLYVFYYTVISDSDSASEDSPMPVRPPRKARSKSDSLGNGDSYDRLWTPRDKSMDESSEHVYSLLGSPQAPLYDDVEKGNDDVTGIREIVLNSSPVKDIDWVEDGRRFGSAQGGLFTQMFCAIFSRLVELFHA